MYRTSSQKHSRHIRCHGISSTFFNPHSAPNVSCTIYSSSASWRFLIQFSGHTLDSSKWPQNLKSDFPKWAMFATNQLTIARVALVGISPQGEYFFHMNHVALAYILYFSRPINDFNIFNPPMRRLLNSKSTISEVSVMQLPGPNPSYTPGRGLVLCRFNPLTNQSF